MIFSSIKSEERRRNQTLPARPNDPPAARSVWSAGYSPAVVCSDWFAKDPTAANKKRRDTAHSIRFARSGILLLSTKIVLCDNRKSRKVSVDIVYVLHYW
jgi:hypothetical protein